MNLCCAIMARKGCRQRTQRLHMWIGRCGEPVLVEPMGHVATVVWEPTLNVRGTLLVSILRCDTASHSFVLTPLRAFVLGSVCAYASATSREHCQSGVCTCSMCLGKLS